MYLSLVAAASFLILLPNAMEAIPQPGIVRERVIIHAPIKFKTIHHHKIKKIPYVIKKHVHIYKPPEESHLHFNHEEIHLQPQPIFKKTQFLKPSYLPKSKFEKPHSNQIQEFNNFKYELYPPTANYGDKQNQFYNHDQEEKYKISKGQDDHGDQEEGYEQSEEDEEEEQDEDYEYE